MAGVTETLHLFVVNESEGRSLRVCVFTLSVQCIVFTFFVIFFLKCQKINRRLHLSKTKHSKFNESGQLAAFYLFSFIWGCSILTSVHPPGDTKTHRPGLQRAPPHTVCSLFSDRRTLQQILLSYGRVTRTLTWCKYIITWKRLVFYSCGNDTPAKCEQNSLKRVWKHFESRCF